MKTGKGYKLFEMDADNNLYPLFIGKKEAMPMGQWLKAQVLPTKGFATRPGFHLGEVCSAPWLMSADGTYKSQRGKRWKRVWCEVEYDASIDYTPVVEHLPKKCFVDKVPAGGYYKFKESGLNRIWFICDQIKITKILTEEERLEVLKTMDYDETVAAKPYMEAIQKRMKIGG